MSKEIPSLSPRVHDLLRSRLAEAQTAEEQKAWITLARFAREKLEALLAAGTDPVTEAVPHPVSSCFNEFQAALEAKAGTLDLTPHLPALRRDMLGLRARLFGGDFGLEPIDEIAERVTLGNEGARGDFADLLSSLGGVGMPDYQFVYRLSDQIFGKATDPELLITLGNTMQRLGTDEGKQKAIAAYKKAFLNSVNGGVDEALAVKYKDLADKLRELGDPESAKAVYHEAARNLLVKSQNYAFLVEIAYYLKEMNFLPESAEVLFWASDCTNNLDDLEPMAKEMNTTLHSTPHAIHIYKRMIPLSNDARQLTGWANYFIENDPLKSLAPLALARAVDQAEEEEDLGKIVFLAKVIEDKPIAIIGLLRISSLKWDDLNSLRNIVIELTELGNMSAGADIISRIAVLESEASARGESIAFVRRRTGPRPVPPPPPAPRAKGSVATPAPAPTPASAPTPLDGGDELAGGFFDGGRK